MKAMYLVLLVHTFDDIPIYVTKNLADAIRRAKQTRAMPTRTMRKVFSTDASSPICVKIVKFTRSGKPVSATFVKDL